MKKKWSTDSANVVVGALAIFVSAYVAYDLASRSERMPAITVSEITKFPSLPAGGDSELGVQYKGAALTNVWFTQLQIQNSGKKAIREEDFWDKIQFNCTQPARIIGVMKAGTWPANFAFQITETNGG